jgi:GTP-binding protein Era
MSRSGFVSLLGRPNAGKSTLLNRLVGAKLAIVSDKPQTTRTRILGVKHVEAKPAATRAEGDDDVDETAAKSGQIVFVDTPGVHRPLHRMNVRMVDAAVQAARDVDVVCLVADASERTGAGTKYVLDLLDQTNRPAVLVLNKIDLVAKHKLLPIIDWFRQQREFAEIIPVSALTGDGLDRLEQVLLSHLPESDPLFPDDYLTDQPERTLAAEMVREQVLAHTRDELPFSTAVVVDQFEEPEEAGGLLRLYCTIYVESASQKPIVIGRAGDMIKRIGTAARLELERFFESKVYLDLHVKVKPGWREDERVLDTLGLEKGKPRPTPRANRAGGRHAARKPGRKTGR